MRKIQMLILSTVLCMVLSGCLYPNDQRADHQMSPEDSIMLVQQAVDRFQEDRTLLPIKDFDMNTPLYERYQIDLPQLRNLQYLSTIPALAFENGGSNIFVLVHAEDDPTVKMMDIVTIQKTGEMEAAVRDYKQKNNNQVPKGDPVHHGWYRLDVEEIGKQNVKLSSVFSGHETSWLINDEGQVVIDYALDIMLLINREELADELTEDVDLRSVLVDHAYYVPVKSAPYYWENGEPVIAAP